MYGSLNTNAFQQAILQYHNMPDPTTKLSPLQFIFGWPIKDFISIHPGSYKLHSPWSARDEASRKRHMQATKRWTRHTKWLPTLAVGNHSRIQNQTGPHPTWWDKHWGVTVWPVHCVWNGSVRSTILNKEVPLEIHYSIETTNKICHHWWLPITHWHQYCSSHLPCLLNTILLHNWLPCTHLN